MKNRIVLHDETRMQSNNKLKTGEYVIMKIALKVRGLKSGKKVSRSWVFDPKRPDEWTIRYRLLP